MAVLLFAFTMVLLGLVLGGVGLLVEAGLGALFTAAGLPPAAPAGPLDAEGWAALAVVLVVAAVALRYAWSGRAARRVRIAMLRDLNKATDGMIRRSEVMASADGRHGHVVLQVDDAAWTPAHPFFAAGTLWTTPPLGETGLWHYVFVERTGPEPHALAPLPVRPGEVAATVSAVFTLRGLRRANVVAWKIVHRLFAASAIPWVTPAVTGLAVFLIALNVRAAERRWRDWMREAFFPHVQGRAATLAPPPRVVRPSHLAVAIERGKGLGPISLHRDLPAGDAAAAVAVRDATAHFQPAGARLEGKLHIPMTDD